MNGTNRCRSIFKSGASETTSQDITRIWIALINRLEQSKADSASKPCKK